MVLVLKTKGMRIFFFGCNFGASLMEMFICDSCSSAGGWKQKLGTCAADKEERVEDSVR